MSKLILIATLITSPAYAIGLGGPSQSIWEMIFARLKAAPTEHPGRGLSQQHPYNPRSRWGGRLKHPILDRLAPTCPPEEPGCTR